MKLSKINVGNSAKVISLFSKDLLKERMMALGFTKGALIRVIRRGPKDNLTVYSIRGSMIALRKEEAALINVNNL